MNLLRMTVVTLLFSLGCSSGETAKPQKERAETDGSESTTAISFAKKKIKVAGKDVTVEIADTDPKRSQGLMHRTQMGENDGMLFIFEYERPLTFWMRNTRIPLSIAYIDSKKKIVNIVEMEPAPDSEMNPPLYPSTGPAMYALEMNKGWFSRNKVKPGQSIEIP